MSNIMEIDCIFDSIEEDKKAFKQFRNVDLTFEQVAILRSMRELSGNGYELHRIANALENIENHLLDINNSVYTIADEGVFIRIIDATDNTSTN